LADKYGLRGEPFAAFEAVGIALPNDPEKAIVTIYNAANGQKPCNVHFIHEEEVETELSRIQSVVAQQKLESSELMNSSVIISETMNSIEQLRSRLAQVSATAALKVRTDEILSEAQTSLKGIKSMIEKRKRQEREEQERVVREAAEATARKIVSVEEAIAVVECLSRNKTPSTISGISARIRGLTIDMETAEERLRIVESDSNCEENQVSTLRAKIARIAAIVSEKRIQLEELADRMLAMQNLKRSEHERFKNDMNTTLSEIENTIDCRTGNFEARIALLRSQNDILRHQRSKIHQGLQIEEELRQCDVMNMESVEMMEREMTRLKMKIKSSITEEEKIEEVRKCYDMRKSKALSGCVLTRERIRSFEFNSIKILRVQKTYLPQLRELLNQNLKEFDDSWTKLCELRSFPYENEVESIHCQTTELVALCDQTGDVVNETLERLENEAITTFLSVTSECKSHLQNVKTRVSTIPTDPESRIGPLSEIDSELRRLKIHLQETWKNIEIHNLHDRIEECFIVSMKEYTTSSESYSNEVKQLSSYLSAIRRFRIESGYYRSEMQRLLELLRNGIVDYGRVEEETRNQLYLFGRTLQSLQQRLRECSMPIPQDVDGSLQLLQDERNRALEEARHRPIRIIATDSDRFSIEVNRIQAMENFVSLTQERYGQYNNEKLRVRFVGESGLDMGGLTREFFTIVSPSLFERAFSMNEKGDMLWFPTNVECDSNREKYLIAAGFLIRLAIENEQPLNILLPLALFSKLRRIPMTFATLDEICPEVATNLSYAKRLYKEKENMYLYLEDGREVTIELFDEYESEQVDLILETGISTAFDAFRKGFICQGESATIASLSASQLHARAVGQKSIDWTQMKKCCMLEGGYTEQDPTIILFWSVFDQLSENDKRAMLTFITGSDLSPAFGFARQSIKLQRISWNPQTLPLSHTCFRRLDLPAITEEDAMRSMFRLCIENHLGFGLI
jgi:hypothetical protein